MSCIIVKSDNAKKYFLGGGGCHGNGQNFLKSLFFQKLQYYMSLER